MSKRIVLTGILMTVLAGGTVWAEAAPTDAQIKAYLDKQKQKALDTLAKSQDAMVMAKFVLSVKMSRGGQEGTPTERQVSLSATIIDAAGLAVVSNASTDMKSLLGARVRGMEIASSIMDVKFVLNDGAEVPAEVVFKDKDLDLLFIRPKEGERKFTFVSLDNAVEPKPLDTIIVVARMDMSANRTPIVAQAAVQGIIEKPQKYYVASGLAVGLPAFDAEGRCFGIYLRRIRGDKPVGNAVILPAADILTVIDQIKADAEEEE